MDAHRTEFSDDDLSKASPDALAALMGIAKSPGAGGWRHEELGEVLLHQLDAPLLFDLGARAGDGGSSGGAARQAAREAACSEVRNFGALFRHPRPPLALLRLTKRFAKTSDGRAANPLPPQVAIVLYYAAIVTALLRHGARISRLSDATLREGVEWVLGQPWVHIPLGDLFTEAHGRLGGPASTGRPAQTTDFGESKST